MKLNMNACNIRYLLLSSIVFAYLFSYASTIDLSTSNDDHVFLSVFNSGAIVEFLANNYNTWSGRSAIELFMVSTIGYHLVWKLGIPLSIVVLAYASGRVSTGKSSITFIAIFILLFSLIPDAINGDASWWVTGFYNYLLPMSVAMYLFSVFFEGNKCALVKLVCIPLAVYVAYMEQIALCLLFCSAILIATNTSARHKYNYFLLAIIAFNFAICISAPGNINRLHLETMNWMPSFADYNLLQKVSLGFDKTYQFITFKYNYPLTIFSLIVILFRLKMGKIEMHSMIPILIVSSFVPLMVYQSLCGDLFFEGNLVDNGNVSRMPIYYNYAYSIAYILSIMYVIFDMMQKRMVSALPIICLLSGFLSVMIMGFSPTVYASGVRVYFYFEIMLITGSMYILNRYFSFDRP